MKNTSCAAALLCLLFAAAPVRAADDLIERLATCQDSWFEWKDDAAKMKPFAEAFNASFEQKGNTSAFVPKKKVLVAGLPVVQALPESVGMGVGFSVVLDATFDKVRPALEKILKRPLTMCETGDGMKSCELEIADKRTAMLMAGNDGKSKTTLVGCYYFYAK